jgi:hypothetical protein
VSPLVVADGADRLGAGLGEGDEDRASVLRFGAAHDIVPLDQIVDVALHALPSEGAIAYFGRLLLRPPKVRNKTAFTGAAERTLAGRFARGDVDTNEYEDRLRVLRAGRR